MPRIDCIATANFSAPFGFVRRGDAFPSPPNDFRLRMAKRLVMEDLRDQTSLGLDQCLNLGDRGYRTADQLGDAYRDESLPAEIRVAVEKFLKPAEVDPPRRTPIAQDLTEIRGVGFGAVEALAAIGIRSPAELLAAPAAEAELLADVGPRARGALAKWREANS